MGKNSAIQWTEDTWNPWYGCHKVSPGCKYCYMFRDMEKYGMQPRVVNRSKTRFAAPLNWKQPRMIFTCSWSDFFIEEADQWRADAWEVIKATPQHTYQILTKRPERIEACLPADWGAGGYSHVWLGVTVEDNARMHRLEPLSRIDCAVRFASFEPLLERIDVTPHAFPLRLQFLDWAIIGGESGNDTGKHRYRECSLDWLTELADELEWHGVPVFVKQLGTHIAKQLGLKHRHGGDIAEFPKGLRVRSMPDRSGKEMQEQKQGQEAAPQFDQRPGVDFYTDMVADFHRTYSQPVRAFPTLPDKETTDRRMNLIIEELKELGDAMQHGKIEEIAKELFDLFYVVAGTAVELGLHHKSYFLMSAVHASNMSKATSLSSAILEARRLEEEKGEAFDVRPTNDKEKFVIFRERDGKIIKPTTYKPAEGMIKAILGSKASNRDLEEKA